METFSLLQESLGATISREALEQASTHVPSIARADCVGISRDLFGVVVSGLPHDEATAFQSALKAHGFITRVVADADIPTLHEAFTIQRIAIHEESLTFTDTMGRDQIRGISDLVFVAGGFLTQSKMKSMQVMESNSPARLHSFQDPAHLETRHRVQDSPTFRLDFFFSTAPHRLRASVSAETMMFFKGRPVQLRDTALLLGAMMDLRELLPADRVGEGLKRPDTRTYYPSLKSYEEEIRWHFHGFKAGR